MDTDPHNWNDLDGFADICCGESRDAIVKISKAVKAGAHDPEAISAVAGFSDDEWFDFLILVASSDPEDIYILKRALAFKRGLSRWRWSRLFAEACNEYNTYLIEYTIDMIEPGLMCDTLVIYSHLIDNSAKPAAFSCVMKKLGVDKLLDWTEMPLSLPSTPLDLSEQSSPFLKRDRSLFVSCFLSFDVLICLINEWAKQPTLDIKRFYIGLDHILSEIIESHPRVGPTTTKRMVELIVDFYQGQWNHDGVCVNDVRPDIGSIHLYHRMYPNSRCITHLFPLAEHPYIKANSSALLLLADRGIVEDSRLYLSPVWHYDNTNIFRLIIINMWIERGCPSYLHTLVYDIFTYLFSYLCGHRVPLQRCVWLIDRARKRQRNKRKK